MNDAARWLEPHVQHAPPQLRARMLAALAAGENVAQTLADAAFDCLRAAQHSGDALDLLAADALLTHACAAAAEAGDAALAEFTAQLDAHRFQQLLDASA